MRQLKSLFKGRIYGVNSYYYLLVNGGTFHSKDMSMMRSFEKRGRLCEGDTTCYSSRVDNNPISGEIHYYGVLLGSYF